MRTILLIAVLASVAACSPDVASGSYLCGPEGDCPEGQACNGDDNICVLASAAKPFSCTAKMPTEPDDTAAQGFVLPNMTCVSVPFVNQNCMLQGDTEDWVRFPAPTGCTAVQVIARVTFPIAFERLGIELWNLDTMAKVAEDTTCPTEGQAGDEIRCLDYTLTSGVNYGIKTHPAGDGTCDGQCAYNRYTLSVQLATP